MPIVYVAMSGGVDSSVAAALLKKRGFNVVGVFMKPWQPKLESFCLWKEDREDAMRVATKLGIPLLTWDFSKEYKREVADYMVKEYKLGRTPNPDVMCNKHIKFGLFLEKALKEGADLIATGHYIRIQKSKIKNQNDKLMFKNVFKLLRARDKNKDQSYFLWTLTQKQLKHCLFPIGDYTKPEVRKLAKKLGLPTAEKKDSQGVCFIGPLNIKEFLKNYIKPKRGGILDTNGSLVGQHDGVFYYTIGQRHGLDIKNGKGPYYVARKDVKKNIIYVGSKKDLSSRKFKLTDTNWINPTDRPVDNRLRKSIINRGLDVRVRYRAPLSKAVVRSNGEVVFKKSEEAITPGQSAVFYRGDELLGGGVIK
ncbi:MAG: tRNA 2-thiouridine(34) synthase MnmA [Candidatus Yanofskybacteria bacterium RIFCSPHIGHO2_01_FULL_43_42]|uniref:tRNA-specific 2-thiouridylase MnmA n=1 Tax=Candidatus Yanofskybacteria bacterium RIFCSPLOWO2_01_FULL_43_22 TaxID=1802695 RepID=A0A1F8GF52_9BACT|nr:MAG: tRNA 2-thiouridine(34) synthase MnmA [Candidatus Yanofskybacteria bacterium RIFCSPHIGHO2_01_FULL_43_42]OGN13503.1 MAG: tRNA 2-thiouridine(34) synthase MnmA [Candidatus Yanofskybacteria bacterium RIFCSPHIGHO2_02_FULL_43_17]OGN23358.1 MAG: tRNA 2-thiouridine(34) synthase MnmA [Candidatus Yanofskybacteria bacterium RIFCSPLOWO2_01_FULL_43_22]